MDYEGYYEDGISIEAYSGQDEKVLVREDSFVPGAAEQLFGMKEGDSKTIEVSFPEDYGDPNVDGKNTTFKVAIKAIERKLNVPEIDDELAKQQGFESLEQLKEALENQKQSVREYAEFQRKQALVMQRVLAESEVDIPGWLLEREKGDQESGPSAEQRLKLNMIMAEISDREGVSVSQQEVGAMLQHRLQGTGLSPEDLSREQIQGVAEEVFVMKVTRALLQKVKVDLVEETEAELETVKKASEQLREVSAVV
jgi:trigger factor